MFAGSGIPAVGRIIQVIDNYVNLSPREVEGIDYAFLYDLDDTPWGDFSFKLNVAQLLTFYQIPSADAAEILEAQRTGEVNSDFTVAGAEDLVRQNGRPEWRWTSTVTWRSGPWGAGLYSSYVGDVLDTSANLADGTIWGVDEWLTHNVYGQYTFDTTNLLNDTRIRFGVRNITNEEPPLADQSFGYLGELHSPRGRWWYLNLNKRF